MTLSKIIPILCLHLAFLLSTTYAQTKNCGAIPVEIVRDGSTFKLLRGGKPYFIKGAGGNNYMDRLKHYGGNSIRTWSTIDAQRILDEAQKLGLTVTMGIAVGNERHGFDYNNQTDVKKQLEEIKLEVLKFKDHPALLAWGVGNELNLNYHNPNVWDAVEDIVQMIKQLDSKHLVTTMLAGVNQQDIDLIKDRCPSLDLIAIQVYGGLALVPQQIRATGWDKPYIVSEWGPTGHWEGPQTSWLASIEESSKEKAYVYKSRYEASIAVDKNCLGSYVFLWGQKQERTPTWYGIFTEAGEENEVVDVMQYLWTGKWPKNRAPRLDSLVLNDKLAIDNIYLKPGHYYDVAVAVHYPEKNKLNIRWELLHESTDLKEGCDHEDKPPAVTGAIDQLSAGRARLKAPLESGAYRLFVYVSDSHNKVATANIPFFVSTIVNPLYPVDQNGKDYRFETQASWSDEFDYEGLPDNSKWSYDVGSINNGWGNEELQYYTESELKNAFVSDGTLKIRALKEEVDGLSYTSARLVSRGKRNFKYGRFEARAKMPHGRGTWPAIWMLPFENKYGDWPRSGEIDILEHVGYDPDVVHISIHTEAYHHSIQTQKTAKTKIQAAATEFHHYRIDWTPDYIKGFVDDVEIFYFANERKTYEEWPFDQQFYCLLNVAVGGFWGGHKGVDEGSFPAVMEIDYVRFYELIE